MQQQKQNQGQSFQATMIMQSNQIFILGGGVAGLSSAIALSRTFPNAKFTVIDKAVASQREPGFGMLLMKNGVKALQKLGGSKVLTDFQPINKSLISDADGTVIFEDTFHADEQIYCCSREKLISGLEFVLEHTSKAFQQLHKRCKKIEVSEEGFVTELVMSDGAALPIDPEDLIVAADGVHSLLCQTLNPTMDRPISPVNELVSATCAPQLARRIGNTFHKAVLCEAGLAFGLVAPTPTQVIGFIQFDTLRHDVPKTNQERQALFDLAVSKIAASNSSKDLFADYAATVDVTAAHIWKPINCELPSKLHTLNAVLVGDAAHPLLPFTSQGVAAAMEDALILAQALGVEKSMEDAMKRFVIERKPVISGYLQGGKRILEDFLQSNSSITLTPYCGGGGCVSSTPTSTSSLQRATEEGSETRASFSDDQIDFTQLSKKAYNYRWATLGEGVIPLTAADSDFPIAKPIQDAMHEYIADGYMNYGPATGLPELKQAIADKYDYCNSPEQVFITNAAASSMFLVAQHLVKQPGDEVIVADPIDFLFQRAVEQAGGVVRRYALKPPSCTSVGNNGNGSHWTSDIRDVARLVTPKTRVLAICNPHNPIGRVWSRHELKQLTDLAVLLDLEIWSDEVWSDITYSNKDDEASFVPTASLGPDLSARTYTVLGFSKGYGLAGLRLGAIIAPTPKDVKMISKRSLADDTGYGVSVLSQVAGVAALRHAGSWQSSFVQHVRGQCQRAVSGLNQIPHVHAIMPQGTFVVFANVSHYLTKSGMDEDELVEYLKEETKVAVVPGSPRFFGPSAAGHIRLSVATSESVLAEALSRLKKGLERLLHESSDMDESSMSIANKHLEVDDHINIQSRKRLSVLANKKFEADETERTAYETDSEGEDEEEDESPEVMVEMPRPKTIRFATRCISC